jgi:sulfide:quinone oxidoreductase
MSKIVIMGAGFAGHTAALYLGDALGKEHEITVVNKFDYFLFVPSLVWVGVNHMKHEKTHFPLKPVYDKFNIHFEHASVTSIHPDDQFIKATRHSDRSEIRLNYDYLINATGPKLNFEGTPGLGPKHGNSYSICNVAHTIETAKKYAEMVQRMQKGEKVKIVLGTGHPGATCQGAAFEYISNIHKDLDKKKIRDKAELLWLSNEPALGDFGVRGVHVRQKGKITGSEDFITEIFKQFDIQYEVQKGVASIDDKNIYWEDYEGKQGQTSYDFAMLIPQFLGMPMNYIGKNGEDVSSKIVNKAGLTLVDGIYGLPYNELVETPDAWPAVYQNPNYQNIFAAGIAFAPPGPHFPSAYKSKRDGYCPCASENRNGLRYYRACGCKKHHQFNSKRQTGAQRKNDGNVCRLHSFYGRFFMGWFRGNHCNPSRCSRQQVLSK